MSISEGQATQQPRFPVMDGFICWARKQNLLFFLPLTACNRVRCNPAKGLTCHNKAGLRSSAETHCEALPDALSCRKPHHLLSVQGKVKEHRSPLIYTSPTVLTTMENLKKIWSTDEFHTDLKQIFKEITPLLRLERLWEQQQFLQSFIFM